MKKIISLALLFTLGVSIFGCSKKNETVEEKELIEEIELVQEDEYVVEDESTVTPTTISLKENESNHEQILKMIDEFQSTLNIPPVLSNVERFEYFQKFRKLEKDLYKFKLTSDLDHDEQILLEWMDNEIEKNWPDCYRDGFFWIDEIKMDKWLKAINLPVHKSSSIPEISLSRSQWEVWNEHLDSDTKIFILEKPVNNVSSHNDNQINYVQDLSDYILRDLTDDWVAVEDNWPDSLNYKEVKRYDGTEKFYRLPETNFLTQELCFSAKEGKETFTVTAQIPYRSDAAFSDYWEYFPVKITIKSSESSKEQCSMFLVEKSATVFHPQIFDIEGDGYDEIIWTTATYAHAYDTEVLKYNRQKGEFETFVTYIDLPSYWTFSKKLNFHLFYQPRFSAEFVNYDTGTVLYLPHRWSIASFCSGDRVLAAIGVKNENGDIDYLDCSEEWDNLLSDKNNRKTIEEFKQFVRNTVLEK